MLQLFEDLWDRAAGVGERLHLAVRTYPRVLSVAAFEWAEVMDPRPALRSGAVSTLGLMGQTGQAFRSLQRARTFSVAVICLTALGIGCVTAVFSVVDHVLLRPLPYDSVDRLMFVGDSPVRDDWEAHSGPALREMQGLQSIDRWAIGHSEPATLLGLESASRVEAAEVSEDFFELFGGRASRGRLLQPDDFASPSVVVLSDGAWRRLFGSDPDVLDRSVRLDGVPMTVIGVLDADFEPPRALVAGDVDLYRAINWSDPVHSRIDSEYLEAVGRITPGATITVAQAEFDQLAERLADAHPDRFRNDQGVTDPIPLIPLQDATVQRVRGGLLLLFGAVGLLLLVSCFNVAHLVLARGESRVQEMAVRRALGAGTVTLVTQLLLESWVLSVAGCTLGLYVAKLSLSGLIGLMPTELPIGTEVSIDWKVLGFAVGMSIATAVLFGLLPALRVARNDSTEHLRGTRTATAGRGAARLRRGMVVAEVALALILVTQAALLAKSLSLVQSHDPGFDPRRIVTMPLQHTAAGSSAELVATMNEVVRAIERVPGVESAGYGINLPFEITGGDRSGWSADFSMVIKGEVQEERRLRLMPVTESYFSALGVPFLAGTVWSPGEVPALGATGADTELPVVLTARTAEEYFGTPERAVGQIIWRDGQPERRWRVVGVAGDVRHWGLDEPPPHGAYLPPYTMPNGFRRAHIAVRTQTTDAATLNAALREAVASSAPGVPVAFIRPMTDWIDMSTAGRRFDSSMFGLFAVIGLILATTGLYGTLLFNVRQRRREIGVRLAIGATSEQVVRQVVANGVALAVFGGLIGLLGAAVTGQLMADRLYGVGAADPTTLLVSVAALLATSAFASWLPARRAGQIDPVEALRSE